MVPSKVPSSYIVLIGDAIKDTGKWKLGRLESQIKGRYGVLGGFKKITPCSTGCRFGDRYTISGSTAAATWTSNKRCGKESSG